MVRIYKDFTFEAAHQLVGYEGDCANVHGHSYKLRVGLLGLTEKQTGPDEGFLMDFSVLKSRVREIFLDRWDHSFLAKGDEAIVPALLETGCKVICLGFRPTAENMCRYILWLLFTNKLPVDSVTLHETETSFAEARIEDMCPDEFSSAGAQEINTSLTLPISEIFGPTIQGEGALVGKKTIFLRTWGCDNKCSWCDTKYSWDGQEPPDSMTLGKISEDIERIAYESGCRHLTLTGGNPCIHGENMGYLLQMLKLGGFTISLETQGTALPPWLAVLDSVTISPKPPSSSNPTGQGQLERFIAAARKMHIPYSIKIVVFDDGDYEYSKEIRKAFALTDEFFLQPGNPRGTFNLAESMARYESLVDKVLKDPDMNNARVLPQLHTWLWGDGRGK